MDFYYLERDIDVSGVSGTGIVAEVIVGTNGKVAAFWGKIGNKPSVATWDNLKDFMSTHGHQGKSRLVPVKVNGFNGDHCLDCHVISSPCQSHHAFGGCPECA